MNLHKPHASTKEILWQFTCNVILNCSCKVHHPKRCPRKWFGLHKTAAVTVLGIDFMQEGFVASLKIKTVQNNQVLVKDGPLREHLTDLINNWFLLSARTSSYGCTRATKDVSKVRKKRKSNASFLSVSKFPKCIHNSMYTQLKAWTNSFITYRQQLGR